MERRTKCGAKGRSRKIHRQLRSMMFEKASLPSVCLKILRREYHSTICQCWRTMLEDDVVEASALLKSSHFTEITKHLCSCLSYQLRGFRVDIRPCQKTLNSFKYRI